MQVVLLAGGKGTRISEESMARPKPMVEIGGIPILVHIMRYFSSFGHHEFIICAGYKGHMIKDFFKNYYTYTTEATTFDMREGGEARHLGAARTEPWSVTVVDTGLETMTGGRLKRIKPYLKPEPFFMTYGDGLADVDLDALWATHQKRGCEVTVTAVRPPARFGRFAMDGGKVMGFVEKPAGGDDWINGGYFVLYPSALERIEGDATLWEKEPMEGLAADRQLVPYFHNGFWKPMDTLRDKMQLEELWEKGNSPWLRSASLSSAG